MDNMLLESKNKTL